MTDKNGLPSFSSEPAYDIAAICVTQEYEAAKLAAAAKPEDLQAIETLRTAIQILDRVREEVRR